MRAWRAGVLLLLLLMICVGVALGQSGSVDCGAGMEAEVEINGASLSWRCVAKALPTATNTATYTPVPDATMTETETPVSTDTDVPTNTPAKSPTIAPPAATMTPFVGAPLCPDSGSEHDKTRWHALWDGIRGCHYDHTHHWDPSIVDHIFGPVGAAIGGQQISYPWRTTNELELKDTGYKYGINHSLPCEFDFAGDVAPTANCVRAFRIQYHSHVVLDPTVRFHSFYAEGELCAQNGNRCGTMKTGGRIDGGFLQAPYKANHVALPVDPPGVVDLNEEPYKAYNPVSWDGVNYLTRYRQPFRSCKTCPTDRNSINDNVSYWATDEPWSSNYGYNLLAGYDTWTYDTAVLISATETAVTPVLICPLGNCRFNNSEELIYLVAFRVPASLDPDGDGLVTYRGYTNVKGEIVSTCTAPGADCVPLEIEHAPVGLAMWSKQDNLGYFIPQPDGTVGPPEFDVSPGNEWWINVEHH